MTLLVFSHACRAPNKIMNPCQVLLGVKNAHAIFFHLLTSVVTSNQNGKKEIVHQIMHCLLEMFVVSRMLHTQCMFFCAMCVLRIHQLLNH